MVRNGWVCKRKSGLRFLKTSYDVHFHQLETSETSRSGGRTNCGYTFLPSANMKSQDFMDPLSVKFPYWKKKRTLPETNIAPENRLSEIPKGKWFSDHPFSGAFAVPFRECNQKIACIRYWKTWKSQDFGPFYPGSIPRFEEWKLGGAFKYIYIYIHLYVLFSPQGKWSILTQNV